MLKRHEIGIFLILCYRIMDQVVKCWHEKLSNVFLEELKDYEERIIGSFKESSKIHKDISHCCYTNTLRNETSLLRLCILSGFNKCQEMLTQDVEAIQKNGWNTLIEENMCLKQQLAKKSEELEKALTLMQILRLSSLPLPLKKKEI